MSEIAKTIKIYTKDNYSFTGRLISIDENFLKLLDYQTGKEMVFPILNVARWIVEGDAK